MSNKKYEVDFVVNAQGTVEVIAVSHEDAKEAVESMPLRELETYFTGGNVEAESIRYLGVEEL